MHLHFALSACVLFTLLASRSSMAQTTQVFRLDGGNSTYAFGVNERGDLQPLYWGGRLGAHDSIPAAHSFPEMASFDSPATTTPQEYAGWGAGLVHRARAESQFCRWQSRSGACTLSTPHRTTPNSADVLLKDISREIYVTLRYSMDSESGILARSASIENREKQPVMIEQAAFAQWTLPPARYTMSYLTGRWAGEWTLNQELIQGGERVIESRRGSTEPSGESVVCDFARSGPRHCDWRRRRAWRSLVWRSGVVGFVANHGGTHAD